MRRQERLLRAAQIFDQIYAALHLCCILIACRCVQVGLNHGTHVGGWGPQGKLQSATLAGAQHITARLVANQLYDMDLN